MFTLCFYCAKAQVPAIQWQKALGGTADDFGYAIQTTPDGGYVVAGSSSSTNGDVTGNHGGKDYWVVKLNAVGNLQWQKSIGGSNNEEARAIQTTSDGGYIVVGYSLSTNGDVTGNHGNEDYWVVKLDATGNMQWQKSLGGSGADIAYSVQSTSDGGYLVAGNSISNNGNVTGNHGFTDYWVVKLNSLGDIQLQKTFGGSGFDHAFSIVTTSDGGFVVAGDSNSLDSDVTGNHTSQDFWIVKLDSAANIQWQKSLGGYNADIAYGIQVSTDGGYLVAGKGGSTDGDITASHGFSPDYWVVKLDNSGNLQWQKSLGGTNYEQAQTLRATSDGGCVVGGYSYSTDGDVTGNHGNYDYWIVKLDASGNLQWQKSLGTILNDTANSIQTTADGGYVVAGYTNGGGGDVTGNHGFTDYWVVKLAPDVLDISVGEKTSLVIYPNPVCDVLQIQNPNNITIKSAKVIALNGKVVYEEIIQNTNTIHVENLAKGVYILEVYSGEEKYVSKFVKE